MYTIYSNKYSLQERETKKHGKVYDVYFRVWDENGKPLQKKLSGFSSKTEAKERYNRFISDNCTFNYNKPPKKVVKSPSQALREVFTIYCEWLKANCKPSTAYDINNAFERFVFPCFGEKNLEEITKHDINRWQDWLSMQKKSNDEYFSYQYQKKIRAYFSTFYTWARSRYGIKSPFEFADKIRSKDIKKEMHIWTREQFGQFIEVVDDPTYRALFTMLFFTGRREGEILAISSADIDLRKGTARFNKSVTQYKTSNGEPWEIVPTKAYKEQKLPLASPVIDELKHYQMGDKFVFGGDRPLPTTSVARKFQQFTEKAELPPIRIHDLRHSFVSMLIHNGVNLAVVADLISDTLEQVTKTYAHMYTEDRDEAIKALK